MAPNSNVTFAVPSRKLSTVSCYSGRPIRRGEPSPICVVRKLPPVTPEKLASEEGMEDLVSTAAYSKVTSFKTLLYSRMLHIRFKGAINRMLNCGQSYSNTWMLLHSTFTIAKKHNKERYKMANPIKMDLQRAEQIKFETFSKNKRQSSKLLTNKESRG